MPDSRYTCQSGQDKHKVRLWRQSILDEKRLYHWKEAVLDYPGETTRMR